MANESLLSSARTFPAKLTNAGFRFTFPSIGQAIAAVLAPPPPDKPA
jgi:NAD dependent epimerase/dehydratase family enzyme